MQNRGSGQPRKAGSKKPFFINARNWSIRAIKASKKKKSPKLIAKRFFLASTVRVCLITQDDRGVNFFFLRQKSRSDFFGVDRWGAFSKKRTPKAEKNDWLRALIKKRTPKAEKNDWLRALIKKGFFSKKFSLPGIWPTFAGN